MTPPGFPVAVVVERGEAGTPAERHDVSEMPSTRLGRSKGSDVEPGSQKLNVLEVSGSPVLKGFESPDGPPPHMQLQNKGTIAGGMTLVASTIMGAGILALPYETAQAGFCASTVLLLAAYLYLAMQALALAEVSCGLWTRQRESGHGGNVTLRGMVSETLGPGAAQVVLTGYLLYAVAILSAYVSKGGDVIAGVLGYGVDDLVASNVCSTCMTAGLGAMVWFGGTKAAADWNNAMSPWMAAFFLSILVAGAGDLDPARLRRVSWPAAPKSLPVIMLSQIYHDVVPYACTYMGGDREAISKVIVLGGGVSVIAFTAWLAVALGLMEVHGDGSFDDPLRAMEARGKVIVSFAVPAFSILAISTSSVTCLCALLDFLQDTLRRLGLRLDQSKSKEEDSNRGADASLLPGGRNGSPLLAATSRILLDPNGAKSVAAALALSIPLIVTCVDPDAFIHSARLAGAYGTGLLFGILPPLMIWKFRRTEPGLAGMRVLPGGNIMVIALFATATTFLLYNVVKDTMLEGEDAGVRTGCTDMSSC